MDAKERRIFIGIIQKMDISCLNLEEAQFVNSLLRESRETIGELQESNFRNLNHEAIQLNPDHYRGKPNTQFPIN